MAGTAPDEGRGTMATQQLSGPEIERIRARYEAERNRRLRPDGRSQYVKPEGEFSHYVEDPNAGELPPRAAQVRNVDVVVVGGGFGGILTAVNLRRQGVDDICIIEKGGGFGGVWYWNRYPGVACDMEAYVYLPLLEEMAYVPPRRYIVGQDIRAYIEMVARHFGLHGRALLGTDVISCTWNETTGRWTVRTGRGDTLSARHVCHTNGTLSRLKLPGIPGVERFRGHTFHTSRWDYAYTGGDETGGLHRLADKRVGIIGTGATAIQCIPHVGRDAGHLYVFQRTPSSVDVRDDRDTDRDWYRNQPPGWFEARRNNFNTLLHGAPADTDLVKDGWTAIGSRMSEMLRSGELAGMSLEQYVEAVERADHEKMESLRRRVTEIVTDPATADRLMPWYRQFCKRPCFHNDYLPTFNRPNVTLVDTGGQGVQQIDETGVIVDGLHYPVDCLIFSTGFETNTAYSQRCGYAISGRDGLPLDTKWKDGVSTLHGMTTRDFPNAFFLSNFQSGFALNYTHTLDEEAQHVAWMIAEALRRNLHSLEPSREAETSWVDRIVRAGNPLRDFFESCTPGYYNDEGQIRLRSLRNSYYPGGSPEFFALIAAWRAEGTLAGMDAVPADAG
jgi:cation diffusion facilitator CzcD-associated flavoprotein CzcO